MAAKFFVGLELDDPDPECVKGHAEPLPRSRSSATPIRHPLPDHSRPGGRRRSGARAAGSTPQPRRTAAVAVRLLDPLTMGRRTAANRIVHGSPRDQPGRRPGVLGTTRGLLPATGPPVASAPSSPREASVHPSGLALRAGTPRRAVRPRVGGDLHRLSSRRHGGDRRAGPRRWAGFRRPTARRRCGRPHGCPRSTPEKSRSGWRRPTSRRSSTDSPGPPRWRWRRGCDGGRAQRRSVLPYPPVPQRAHQPARTTSGAPTGPASFVRVIEAVRAAVADDAVVGLRLSCDELAPWAGLVPEAAAELAAELAPSVDYLTVVRGSIYSRRPDPTRRPHRARVQPGPGRPGARRRSGPEPVNTVPVIAQGSLVDWGQAEWAVGEGERSRRRRDDPSPAGRPPRWPPSSPTTCPTRSGPASSATRPVRCETPGTRSSPVWPTPGPATS